MNIFRFLGDISHILSFVILLNKIVKGKSSVGISLRTQEMYAGEHSAAHLLYSCFGLYSDPNFDQNFRMDACNGER